jgi:Spy/CpxP family protein refolding chaperone
MSMRSIRIAALVSVAAASALAAQSGGSQSRPVPPTAEGRAPAASMLLAHTGELQLTDAQVVRLAAIARRAEARRRTMRASMDSVRARFGPDRAPADSAARRQMRDRFRADMDRLREQQRADQRDAIAVLTPDQQARAWDFAASRARGRMGARSMQRMERRGPNERFRGRRMMPRPPREG